MLSKTLLLRHLGMMQYTKAMSIMKQAEQSKKDFLRGHTKYEPPDTLFICEHKPVYTIGMRTQKYVDPDIASELQKLGAEFYFTDRGGLITFHGPGQLVCYPVINLKNFTPGVRWYICKLEEVLIKTCTQFGIDAKRTSDVGIWVGENKIAAVGIHCSRYITSHGIALNCNTDLSWFDHIVPCGIEDKGVTSLSKELGRNIDTEETWPVFVKKMENVFGCQVIQDEDSFADSASDLNRYW